MRFMIIVRANAQTESEANPAGDDPQLLADMAAYHQQLSDAGVLLDGAGLRPSSAGWRIRHRAGKASIVDGPFAETKELIAGYTLIEVPTREAALEWSRRFPAPFGRLLDGEVEVRQLWELDDFPPSAAVEQFRELGIGEGAGSARKA